MTVANGTSSRLYDFWCDDAVPAQWVQYGAAPSVGVIVAIAVLHAVLLASVFRQLCIAEVRRFTFRVIMLSIVAVAIVAECLWLVDPGASVGLLPWQAVLCFHRIAQLCTFATAILNCGLWIRVRVAMRASQRIKSKWMVGRYGSRMLMLLVFLVLPVCGEVGSPPATLEAAIVLRAVWGTAIIVLMLVSCLKVRQLHASLALQLQRLQVEYASAMTTVPSTSPAAALAVPIMNPLHAPAPPQSTQGRPTRRDAAVGMRSDAPGAGSVEVELPGVMTSGSVAQPAALQRARTAGVVEVHVSAGSASDERTTLGEEGCDVKLIDTRVASPRHVDARAQLMLLHFKRQESVACEAYLLRYTRVQRALVVACVIAAAWFIFHAVLLYTRWITRDEWLSYVAMQAVAQVSALALAVTNVWVPSTRSRTPVPTKPVSNIARKLERISQLTAQDAVGPRSSRANGGGQLFSMAVAVADHLQRASRAESIVADTHEASVPHLSQAVVSVCSKDVQPSASVVALKSAAPPTDASTAARAPDTTSPMTSARRASARQPSWRGMAWPPTPTTATGCEPTV